MNCALPRIEPLNSQTGVFRFHEVRPACLFIIPSPPGERVRVRGNNPNNSGSNKFDPLYDINFDYNRSI
jgi:hypothetical protein